MDWSEFFPDHFAPVTQDVCREREDHKPCKRVEFADIGCGYGGLLGQSDVLLLFYTH